MTHTPGPWVAASVCTADDGMFSIRDAKGHRVARAHQRADSTLIAAAPALLAALERLAGEFESRMDGIENWTVGETQALRQACDAIAGTKGGDARDPAEGGQ